ncbi:uncharacterized protein LOC129272618 [Lytechinus pictus]|uniref:uncharacterized protein LOC129272618 n=1 Tax=Lytechinus pictus TaxID=7653 RepID=UPI0030BA22C1
MTKPSTYEVQIKESLKTKLRKTTTDAVLVIEHRSTKIRCLHCQTKIEIGKGKPIRRHLNSAAHQSSNFHWKQSVYRKIQALGLAPMYTRDEEKRLLLQQLMALPFLPVEVVPEFRRLRLQSDSPLIDELFDYLESTWITNPTWPVRVWSTYGKAIRTNNDAEGYNHRLNRRAGGKSMGVYQLSSLLFKESQLVDLTVRMVDRRLLTRHQRRQTRTMQARVFRAWEEHRDGERTTQDLLTVCAHSYGHAPA